MTSSLPLDTFAEASIGNIAIKHRPHQTRPYRQTFLDRLKTRLLITNGGKLPNVRKVDPINENSRPHLADRPAGRLVD